MLMLVLMGILIKNKNKSTLVQIIAISLNTCKNDKSFPRFTGVDLLGTGAGSFRPVNEHKKGYL